MVKFEIEKDKFKQFLKTCSMVGAVQFRDKKTVKKAFFNSFYLDVNPGGFLKVLTLDTYRKKTSGKFILKGVRVIEDGIIPIMDYETIMKCLKNKSLEGIITVSSKDIFITLENKTDAYEIRQKENKDIEEMKTSEVIQLLEAWETFHEFREDGVLVMHHPDAGDIPYPMKIRVNKEDLDKVVGDTLSLYKENKTRLIFENGELRADLGAGNSNIKSKHTIKHENLTNDSFEFDYEFYSLQTIFPNLFDDITISIKKPSAVDCLNIYIRSVDKSNGIECDLGMGSIIKE